MVDITGVAYDGITAADAAVAAAGIVTAAGAAVVAVVAPLYTTPIHP